LSDSDSIKKWSVTDDGTLTPVSISSMSDLAENEVFIIVEENMRKIFIWKGEQAPVRRKFISAKAAQQMRQEKYGMVYRIESLDPGLEGNDFLSIFGGVATTSESTSPSRLETNVYTTPATTPTPAPKRAPATTPTPAPKRAPATTPTPAPKRAPTTTPTPAPKRVPATTPTPAPKSAPTTTPIPIPTREPTTAPTARIVKETEVVVTGTVQTTTTPIEDVTTKLSELEIPPEMEREIIIIGSTVFSAIKEHLALFSKDVVKLEPMDDLPSGVFPADQYQVRLFIEEGRVLFTELLRQKTRSEREEFIDDMRKSLQDLSKMGI
jgi:hypothetical protein